MEGTPEEQGTLLPIQRKEGFTPSLHHRQRQSKTIPVLRSLSQIRKIDCRSGAGQPFQGLHSALPVISNSTSVLKYS